jgi:hypothetical protein
MRAGVGALAGAGVRPHAHVGVCGGVHTGACAWEHAYPGASAHARARGRTRARICVCVCVRVCVCVHACVYLGGASPAMPKVAWPGNQKNKAGNFNHIVKAVICYSMQHEHSLLLPPLSASLGVCTISARKHTTMLSTQIVQGTRGGGEEELTSRNP